jgi:hypothetical protein
MYNVGGNRSRRRVSKIIALSITRETDPTGLHRGTEILTRAGLEGNWPECGYYDIAVY